MQRTQQSGAEPDQRIGNRQGFGVTKSVMEILSSMLVYQTRGARPASAAALMLCSGA